MKKEVDDVTYGKLNDNATNRVSLEEKKSLFDVTAVSTGYCIAMSGLFTGAALSIGLTLQEAILASFVGNGILLIYGGLLAVAGAKEGVASSMLARHSFGRQGSIIVSLVLSLTMLGWFSVQVGFFGDTINVMFPNAGFISQKYVAAFWGGILMLLTAYFGYKGLSFLSKVAIPLIFITSIIGIYQSVSLVGGFKNLMIIEPSNPMNIGAGIVLVVGSFAGGASAQADISRYAKKPSDAIISSVVGYIGGNLFTIMAGFVTNLATGAGDLPSAMLSLGLGIPALIVLIGAQWTTNDNNLYTASLGLSNVFKIKKSRIVLVTGVAATIVGALGLSNHFIGWLSILGIGIPPMAGIIIADYYFLSNRKYEFGTGTKYCGVNIYAFISWGVGILVGYFVAWGIGSINGLIISLALYLILMKTIGKNKKGLIGEYIEK